MTPQRASFPRRSAGSRRWGSVGRRALRSASRAAGSGAARRRARLPVFRPPRALYDFSSPAPRFGGSPLVPDPDAARPRPPRPRRPRDGRRRRGRRLRLVEQRQQQRRSRNDHAVVRIALRVARRQSRGRPEDAARGGPQEGHADRRPRREDRAAVRQVGEEGRGHLREGRQAVARQARGRVRDEHQREGDQARLRGRPARERHGRGAEVRAQGRQGRPEAQLQRRRLPGQQQGGRVGRAQGLRGPRDRERAQAGDRHVQGLGQGDHDGRRLHEGLLRGRSQQPRDVLHRSERPVRRARAERLGQRAGASRRSSRRSRAPACAASPWAPTRRPTASR